ncbi:hypothetical protein [Actinoplanes sp. NPDC049118]|uniref:hypothetical protein n=1 Tax=Actinoplanes sp. NPDC049118 TaxID=3155769 RepID=UPI0033DB37CE
MSLADLVSLKIYTTDVDRFFEHERVLQARLVGSRERMVSRGLVNYLRGRGETDDDYPILADWIERVFLLVPRSR